MGESGVRESDGRDLGESGVRERAARETDERDGRERRRNDRERERVGREIKRGLAHERTRGGNTGTGPGRVGRRHLMKGLIHATATLYP